MGSPEDDDRAAAEAQFLEIFNATAVKAKDKRERIAKENLRKKNLGIFLINFKREYSYAKKKFMSFRDRRNDSLHATIIFSLEGCRAFLNRVIWARRVEYKNMEEDKYEYEANNLGKALGSFLAAIEYGVADPFYDPKDMNIDKSISQIINLLKELGNGVTPKFIANRIKAIARKRPDLDEDHKRILAYIAAEFSKK